MRVKKKLWVIVAVLLLAALLAGGAVWVTLNYHIVGMRLYAKQARFLDLRGESIRVSDYDTLREKLPEAEIRWDVPFQGGVLKDDARHVSVSKLSMADVVRLDYLPELETVAAYNCGDYEALAALQQRRPEVKIRFMVPINGEKYHQATTVVEEEAFSQEDIRLLQYLPQLETVVLSGGESMETVQQLQEYCRENRLNFAIRAGMTLVYEDQQEVELEYASNEHLNLLECLTDLKKVHFYKPVADAEKLIALKKEWPDVEISWEQEIGGQTMLDTDTEVDLSGVSLTDLDYVKDMMEYLPDAELLILGLCGIDNPDWGNSKAKVAGICPIENEAVAAFRDEVREQYKVAWTVRLGPNIALRTDKDNFMPNHFGVGILTDEYAYNLRYCEDMVCLDVGHMTLTDISFVEFMPKLKYLILAWTEVQYIEPIRTCKNLIFLELDNSCIRDYSPLVDCTALQDLNIGKTYCDITPILEMTWLNNLYMIFGSQRSAYLASQALPDTRVAFRGTATVGAGWRRLPNYYDMRDCLGMYYMN
ncbi:MAG: hypothetical protein IJO21_07055 [Oscillospiraceae bacterium]|nr:hypothetical protein [Oscillospiraceae bacterium]MBQ7130778.1 hypothetical protein [Oscillospiraceae bacterium]